MRNSFAGLVGERGPSAPLVTGLGVGLGERAWSPASLFSPLTHEDTLEGVTLRYQAQIYLYITFRWDELTEIYTPLNLNNFGETRVGSTEPFSQQFLVIPLHCAKSK